MFEVRENAINRQGKRMLSGRGDYDDADCNNRLRRLRPRTVALLPWGLHLTGLERLYRSLESFWLLGC